MNREEQAQLDALLKEMKAKLDTLETLKRSGVKMIPMDVATWLGLAGRVVH
jgi:hypothetical protein